MTELSSPALAGLVVLGVAAGWFGALVGIGGGVLVVPALVLGFGVDFPVAVAASLVAVIATSTTAGSVYVGRGLTNMRLAMTLEVATTIGGISGGLVATILPASVLGGVFAALLFVTAFLMLRGASHPAVRIIEPTATGTGWEQPGELAGGYLDLARGGIVRYRARRVPVGAAVSLMAGAASGLLGVGGGFLKVPAMHLGMDIPIKVAAATSNFMIGVTAAASVFIYFARGYVEPLLTAPLVIGVVGGSFAGTRMSGRAQPAVLKLALAGLLLLVAVLMALRSLGAGFDA